MMKHGALLLGAVLALGAGSAGAATVSTPPPIQVIPKMITPAQEQQLAGELSQCFTMKSTGEDRLIMARWLIGAMASAPQVADVAKVDPAKKDQTDRQLAGIFTRLMTVDCASQARPLFHARSDMGFRAAGETLGRLAMQDLMGDPKAAAAMVGGYVSYLREEDFAPLAK